MNEFFEMLAALPWLFVGLSVLLGLLIGSFLNVVIHRVPIMMDNELRAECVVLAAHDAALEGEVVGEVAEPPVYNIVTPRSACPKCARSARARCCQATSNRWACRCITTSTKA